MCVGVYLHLDVRVHVDECVSTYVCKGVVMYT